MYVDLNGRRIDVSKVLPLLMKDIRALHRRGVNIERAIDEKDVEMQFQMAFYILNRADPAVTEAELESLTADAYAELWGQINAAATQFREADRPLPSTSTSSPVPSDGPNAT